MRRVLRSIPCWIGFALVVFSVGYGRYVRRPMGPPPSAEGQAAGRFVIDSEIRARLADLEDRRTVAARTVWAPEIEAERHEAVFVRLWDELRASVDPLEVLEQFRFGSLDLREPASPQTLDHGIQLRSTSGPPRTLTPSNWREFVEEWRRGGWALDGSEWRHLRFDPATNGIARSVISMELHLVQSAPERRAIVRGQLQVEWLESSGPDDAGPLPRRVDATSLAIYQRDGPPLFEPVLRDAMQPDAGSNFTDPLLVHDLDGDGFDEIVLGGKNQMYWNRGGFVFEKMGLCPRRDSLLSTAIFGDFDGDGHVDFLGADNRGLVLFRGDVAGGFTGTPRHQPLDHLLNPFVLTSGDIDGDGDLDLFLAQYKVPLRMGQMPTPYYDANDGFPAYLLLNDGHGNLRDATAESGLAAKRFRRTYSASFCDFDGDGHSDLVTVNDFAGVDLYFNDGKGHFRDVTDAALPERHLFGMSHAIADFDDDGRPDLFAVGMTSPAAARLDHLRLGPPDRPDYAAMRAVMTCGNRTFLNRGGRFEPAPFANRIADSGWAWGVTAFDFDNDGDLDLYLTNGHRSHRSVSDYDPQFWMNDIYVATSGTNQLLDLYFQSKASRSFGAGESYGGHHRNVLFLNAGAAGWHGVAWLLGVATPEDSRAVVSDDLDGDGRPDLVVLTEEYWPQPRHELLVYRNTSEEANWVAVRVLAGAGIVVGEPTEVVLRTQARAQRRFLVSGAGYRSQSPMVAHFGLGREDRVEGIEVKQRGKVVWSIEHPPTRQVLRTDRPG